MSKAEITQADLAAMAEAGDLDGIRNARASGKLSPELAERVDGYLAEVKKTAEKWQRQKVEEDRRDREQKFQKTKAEIAPMVEAVNLTRLFGAHGSLEKILKEKFWDLRARIVSVGAGESLRRVIEEADAMFSEHEAVEAAVARFNAITPDDVRDGELYDIRAAVTKASNLEKRFYDLIKRTEDL